MSKVSKLNELRDLVRAEKVRIAKEVCEELRAGTFDINDFSAVQALEIAKDHVEYEVFYQEECKANASSWDGMWTRPDEAKVEQLYLNLGLIVDALKKAEAAFEAKIPF